MADIQDFDFSTNLLKVVIWQYDNATNLKGLLEAEKVWYDENQQGFWEDWITDVFDLRTANAFGLSVWAIILGQSLFSSFVVTPSVPSWGFGADNLNFQNGNFASSNSGTNTYTLATARILLRLRYFQLTSSGTVPETNRMLKYIFADYGNAYLLDNLDMTQTYVFEFAIPAEIRYMLNNTDVLPRPAGVLSTITEL